MSKNDVVIRNMHFSRGEKTIFDGLDISLERGKVTVILGPSGTGKTTLLRLIGGQLKPDSGEIIVFNQKLQGLTQRQLFWLRKKMGLLFQSGALFTDLSVYENVAFALREHTDLDDAMIKNIVLMKLEAVGLRGARDLMPAELSGGMARRVALARAIVMDPQLMMYDEPFAGQDPISMAVLIKLIQRLNQLLNLTSVIVSHDVAEACSIADKIYLIAGGSVLAEGSPDELLNSNQDAVEQFMHGQADGVVPFHYPAADYLEELLDD